MRKWSTLAVLLLAAGLKACATVDAAVNRSPFGRTADGTSVDLFTLTNARGVEIRVITYGAIITSIRTPDRNGRVADIVLGFDDIEGYLTRSRFFGAVVGRYGNRIGKGQFTIDGTTYRLATNNGANHLHGGVRGFDKVVWKGEPFERNGGTGVVWARDTSTGHLRWVNRYASGDNGNSVYLEGQDNGTQYQFGFVGDGIDKNFDWQ